MIRAHCSLVTAVLHSVCTYVDFTTGRVDRYTLNGYMHMYTFNSVHQARSLRRSCIADLSRMGSTRFYELVGSKTLGLI